MTLINETNSALIAIASLSLAGVIIALLVSNGMGRVFRNAYSSTRAKAKRSKLLQKHDYERALKTRGINDLAEFLEERGFGNAESLSLARTKGNAFEFTEAEMIDKILNEHLIKSLKELENIQPGSGSKAIGLLYKKWDVWNLKTLIRGLRVGLERERIRALLVDVGSMKGMLDRLAECRDLKSLAVALEGTQYHDIIEEHSDSPKLLESAIERGYYERLIETELDASDPDEAMLIRMMRMRLDSKNILLACRLVRFKGDLREHPFIRGGSVDGLLRDALSEKSFDAIRRALAGTRYGSIVSRGLNNFEATGSLTQLERLLEKEYVKEFRSLSRSDPLGMGVSLSYVCCKEAEVENLRIIAKCKAAGFDEDAIRELLVMPS